MAQNQHHHLNQMAQPDLCWQITLQCLSPWQIPQQVSGFSWVILIQIIVWMLIWWEVWGFGAVVCTQKQRGFLQSVLCKVGQRWGSALKSLLCALDSVLAALGGAKGGPMWKCEKGHTACYPEFPMAVCELGHGQLFMCWGRKNCEIVWGTKESDLFGGLELWD